MEVTIKQRTWTPFTYISEETMIREMDEINNIIDDINIDFNALEYMIDSIADGSCVYTEATEGIITKLGRKIANAFRKMIRWINNTFGSTKMEDMNNVEKMEAITKKYPLIKDRIMVLAQQGLLDVSAIKDMNDFIDQYSKLDKWADAKELTKAQKLLADGKKVMTKLEEGASSASKGFKTATEFIKNAEEFRDQANATIKKLSKVKPEDLEKSCDNLDKMMHRDNPSGYDPNNKPINQSKPNNGNTTTEAVEGPLRPLALSDVQIVRFLQQSLNMIINVFNTIANWIVRRLNSIKRSKQRVAAVTVGLGRMMDKYGTIDNIIEAHKKGKIKMPDYITIKNGKFIIDVGDNSTALNK